MTIAREVLTSLNRKGLAETIRSLRERVFWKALKILRPRYLSSPYGPKFHLNLADTTFRYYIRGAYGHLLSDFIKSLDREFVFLDIGANQGLYSFVAAANPVCTKVWAFEPVKGTFDLLRSNAVINEDSNKITFVNCAISNAKGERRISISPRHTGAASLEHHYSGAVTEIISCIDSSDLDDIVAFAVAADAKLTHPAEVNLTHPGQADGLLAVDVDPGASSGSQSPAPARTVGEIDRQGARLFAQHRAALPS